MPEIIGYIASIGIGIVLGMLGGGGSILAIPILVYLFKVDAVTASAYSLFIVGVTSFTGAFSKYRDNLVDLESALWFGIPSVAGIFAMRKWIVPSIPDVIVEVGEFIVSKRLLVLGVFSILMIIAAYSFLFKRGATVNERYSHQSGLLIFEGLLIGLITGFVGAGGGFLIIPALIWMTGLPFRTAVGTSLFIIAINSLLGFLGDVLNYPMDWNFLATLTGLAVAGIFIGHLFQKRISVEGLRKLFGWFVLLLGIGMLIGEIFASRLRP